MFREFIMFWTRETLSNIRRNRLMSVLAISTVTIGLFILGAFFLAWVNLQSNVETQTQKLDLVVVLKPEVSARRRLQIYNAAHIAQVKDLQIALKSQVLKEMQKQYPDVPVADFQGDANPLGDELRIKLRDARDIFSVRAYLDGIKGVQRTRDDLEPVRQLLRLKQFLTLSGFVALFILGMAILLIIHNAIRLTIFARRREIRIMELVGATPWFIKMPFLFEGMIYGMAGAAVASGILTAFYLVVLRSNTPIVRLLLPLTNVDVLWQCTAWMLVSGAVFGLLGSGVSLTRSTGKAAHI